MGSEKKRKEVVTLVWCFIQIDDDSVSPEGKPAQARILRCNA
jgi:hypothetical protein